MTDTATFALKAKAWPFEQARAILKRRQQMSKAGRGGTGPVVFETGYGPSGLPHIGTFGEVVRTTMVRQAFIALTEGKIETRLICVSDDMDGMRKVPPTVPNPEKLEPFLQQPLTAVPDPFGTHESYGHHMNARLCAFLDGFGFEYEFASASELYKNGTYDNVALNGGSGKNARAKLVIASGALSAITLTAAGEGYKDDEELTFDDADVGGSGGSGGSD